MSISKKIRLQSKDILSNNWTPAITVLFVLLTAGFLVFSAISLVHYLLAYLSIDTFIINLSDTVAGIITLVFLSPIFNGALKFFYELSKTKKADVSNVFFYMKGKKYWKTVLFNIRNSLYIVLIFSIYFLLWKLFKEFNDFIPNFAQNILLTICAVFAVERLIYFSIKRITRDFIYIDNSDENIKYYNKANKIINRRHYWDIFKLFISFIPWLALCFFVLPIFYVIPYAITCFATSEKWLIKLYKDGKMV